jgi:hypothetical protein
MTFDPSNVRRAYWSRLADEYDQMQKATVSLTTGELRTLLMDAELAERAAEERQVTADYHRQQSVSLRAEVQRLESLLRQG